MPKVYEPYPKEWWTESRIELYRLFAEGGNTYTVQKLLDESGKRIFRSNKEITYVKKAFDNHDDPFASPPPPGKTGEESDGGNSGGGDTELKQRPIPPLRGATFTATIKPRVIELDPRLFVLYDLTKAVFPSYDKSPGEWIWDAIVTFYDDYAEKLELGRLFAQDESKPLPAKVEEVTDDNREIAELAGTTRAEGESKAE